jgi:hypothetical protein
MSATNSQSNEPYDQAALDAASREVHMMLLREGSSWGTKACEEMGRVFMTAYLKAAPRSEIAPQRAVWDGDMHIESDCIINGLPVKAGTVLTFKNAAPQVSSSVAHPAKEASSEGPAELASSAQRCVAGAPTDKDRLDWLFKQGKPSGLGWTARDSTTGRGYRLHQTVDGEPSWVSPRAAIDAAMKRQSER